MQSIRMSALLNDVDAALKEETGPNMTFQSGAKGDFTSEADASVRHPGHHTEPGVHGVDSEEQNIAAGDGTGDVNTGKDNDIVMDQSSSDDDELEGGDFELLAREAREDSLQSRSNVLKDPILDAPQAAIILLEAAAGDTEGNPSVDSPVRYPVDSERTRSAAYYDAPDAPGFDLFPEGSEEWNDFNKPLLPAAAAADVVDKTDTTVSAAAPVVADPPEDVTAAAPIVAVPAEDDVTAAAPIVVVPAEDVTAAAPAVADPLEDVTAAGVCEPITPVDPKTLIVHGATGPDVTTGPETLDRKNRHKRAAKELGTPPKMKKIKISQDVDATYLKFVQHGRRLKRQPNNYTPKEFIRVDRYFCCYKAYYESLRPRQYLSSELMNVWIERFNHEAEIVAQRNPRMKKKFAFTQRIVHLLIADPAAFDNKACLKELKYVAAKFKVLKDDLLYFPIVKDEHWVVCCINIVHKQFHVFDSMRSSKDSSLLEHYANNLFLNFNELVKEPKLVNFNFDDFTLTTPDHPRQTTLYDCGFFSILYMENFNGKVMLEFDNNSIPDLRKVIAASLIENRDNGDAAVEELMEEELVRSKK